MRIKLDVLAAAGMAATIKLLPGEKIDDAYNPGRTGQDAHLLHETLRTMLPYVTYLELKAIFARKAAQP